MDDEEPVQTASTTPPDTPKPAPRQSQSHVSSLSPSPSPSPSPWIRDPLHTLQNSLLHFLSQANNETLGACVVGLAASTYLLLGRVGLVLIGAVGGIALYARWDSLGRPDSRDSQALAQDGQRRRNELGIEVAKRVLDWRESKRDGQQPGNRPGSTLIDTRPIDFSNFPPESRVAVNRFTDAIIGDYVKWWYHPLLPADQSFPAACRQSLAKLIVTFANHLARKRTADPVLDFLANSTSVTIVFLNELSNALRSSPRQEPSDAIRAYLQHQPKSNLANLINTDEQDHKLNIIADDILYNFLEPSSYDCFPARSFLREVLSGLILKPVIDGQAKADSINGWIVHLLEDGEPELMNAIHAGVDEAATKLTKDSVTEKLATSPHQRRVSQAEEAMDEASKEVKRMNAMIAEEEASRQKENGTISSDEKRKASSLNTLSTETGPTTPTSSSSDSEQNRVTSERAGMPPRSRSVSYLLGAEGNAITSPISSPTKASSFDVVTNGNSVSTPVPGSTPAPAPASAPASDTMSTPVPAQGQTPLPAPAVDAAPAVPVPSLTLHKASITIMDLGDGDDSIIMKKEPAQNDLLVQIEPASSRFPGWMVMKRYPDFVKLHVRLMTYARVGVPQFNKQHPEVPSWRGISRRILCADLELYLRDALKYEALAESEAMKRFLEKETGMAKAAPQLQAKNVLVQGGAALENVGKGFVSVLGQGGKGIAGGGKVVIGGVQGAFGAITAATKKPGRAATTTTTTTTPSRPSQEISDSEQAKAVSTSASASASAVPLPVAPSLERLDSEQHSHESSQDELLPTPLSSEEILHLPPPPTEISDEYSPDEPTAPVLLSQVLSNSTHEGDSTATASATATATATATSGGGGPFAVLSSILPHSHVEGSTSTPSPAEASGSGSDSGSDSKQVIDGEGSAVQTQQDHQPEGQDQQQQEQEQQQLESSTKHHNSTKNKPLTTEETSVLVDLMFAIITELYSLSPSAWTIRLSLLSAAKSFLLRPQNPQLESIRVLLQESVLDANFSDRGMAGHIDKLRYKAAPTEEERARWSAQALSPDESQKLKVKARRLLVERGMPQALTSVMGQQASGEALGRIFDCLQIHDLARGFVFALMLQAIRAACQ